MKEDETIKAKDTPLIKKMYAYIESIENGEIESCKPIRKTIERFRRDQKRNDIEFRHSQAWLYCSFISLMPITTGEKAGDCLELSGWQIFFIANIFGWYVKGTNRRKYQKCYLEIPKKNGKTPLGAGIALAKNLFDGVPAPECYFTANSKDQANEAYKEARKMIKISDFLKDYFDDDKTNITNKENGGIISRLSSDAGNLDGKKPIFSLVDEYHVHPTDEVYEVQKSGGASHLNPLTMVTTTAGIAIDCPCKKLRDRLLKGLLNDAPLDDYFVMIYQLDKDDDWQDEKVWKKVNPNLGVSVQSHFLKGQVDDAKESKATEFFVLTKHFNKWQQNKSVWLDSKYIKQEKLFDKLVQESLESRETRNYKTPVYLGLDLSSKDDLTGLTVYFDQINFYKTFIFCPEDTAELRTKSEQVNYNIWIANSEIIITKGNVVDYNYIINKILELDKIFHIESLGFDPWAATQVSITLEDNHSIPMVPVRQNYPTLSPAFKAMFIEFKEGESSIEENSCVMWSIGNVISSVDSNGNEKPDKAKSKEKIDPLVSMVNAKAAQFFSVGYLTIEE